MKKLSIIAVLWCLCGVVVAQDEACMPSGGFYDSATGQCNIKAGITMDIDYPAPQDQSDVVTQAVGDFVQQTKSDFIANFSTTNLPTTMSFPWDLTVTYDQYQYADNVLSLNFTIYEFTGGAHGNTAFQTFTFNLDSGQPVALSDLLDDAGLEVVAEIARQDLKDRLGEMLDAQWLEQGTAPTVENYQNFALTPDSMLFFLPPYQVAPYAAGTQTITVPLTALSGVLSTDALAASS